MSMHTSSSAPSLKMAGAAQGHTKAVGKSRVGEGETGGSFSALINGLSAPEALSDMASGTVSDAGDSGDAASVAIPQQGDRRFAPKADAGSVAVYSELTGLGPQDADASESGAVALTTRDTGGEREPPTQALPDSAVDTSALGATVLAMTQLPMGFVAGPVTAQIPAPATLPPSGAAATSSMASASAVAFAPASAPAVPMSADTGTTAPTGGESVLLPASAPFAAMEVLSAGLVPTTGTPSPAKPSVSLDRAPASAKTAASQVLAAQGAAQAVPPSSPPGVDRMDAPKPLRPAGPSAASANKIDARDVMARVLAQPVDMSFVASTSLAGMVVPDSLVKPAERWPARGGSSGSGFEGVLGTSVGPGRAEAGGVYDIAPSAAVVPDTAVAETVSYWVSQGVQSAQLTLEGFGSEPVEVNIVLHGDQAQIDFRTDQADVRQVLEAATSQLKDLLSNQGLQLTGMSVGTSGSGHPPSEQRQQKPPARQMAWASSTQPVTLARASANTAVGTTLDLFV